MENTNEAKPQVDESSSHPKPDCLTWSIFVAVIALLVAAICVPNYLAAQKKARLSHTKANMHTVQLALESAASDSGGTYPRDLKDLLPYFPGGGGTPHGKPGTLGEVILIEISENPAKFRDMSPSEFYGRYVQQKVPTGKPWLAVYLWPPDQPTTYGVTGNELGGPPASGAGARLLFLSNQ